MTLLIVGISALVIVGLGNHGGYLLSLFEARTYGQIYVDSPEVYTRERLVNDRFIHEAWLKGQLDLSDTFEFRPTEQSANYLRTTLALGGAPGGEEPASGTADPPAPEAAPNGGEWPDLGITPTDIFEMRNSFRAIVRGQIIENQLDDRHDLLGNSLYLFKFDVTIIPGVNTLDSAKIAVDVSGSPSYETGGLIGVEDGIKKYVREYLKDVRALDTWRDLYYDWIQNTQDRLNTTFSELVQAYRNDAFPLAYYRELFHTVLAWKGLSGQPQSDRLLECVQRHWESHANDDSERHSSLKALLSHLLATDQSRTVPAVPETAGRDGATSIWSCLGTPFDGAGDVPLYQASVRQPGNLSEDIIIPFISRKSLDLVFGVGTPVSVLGLDDANPAQEASGASPTGPGSLDMFVQVLFDKGASLDQPGLFTATQRQALLWAVIKPQTEPCVKVADPGAEPVGAGGADASDAAGADSRVFHINYFRDAPGGGKEQVCIYTAAVIDKKKGTTTVQPPHYKIDGKLWQLIFELRKAFRLPGPDGAPGPEWNILLPTGLFNFVEAISRVETFSYSVTPRKEFNLNSTESLVSTSLGVDVPLGGVGENTRFATAGNRSRSLSALGQTVSVVGFGAAQPNDETEGASFGWVFSPTTASAFNESGRRFSSVQRSVFALVSIPAWWRKVKFTVRKEWLDDELGSTHAEPATTEPSDPHAAIVQEYTIALPVDFEAIDLILLGSSRRSPEVYSVGLEQPIRLSACRGAGIVLPGKRLWRSSVVTVGGQTADRITVLPNMKGIIAHFEMIAIPPGMETLTEVAKLPVTVWTSEGSYTLAERAEIRVPPEIQKKLADGTAVTCPKPASGSAATE